MATLSIIADPHRDWLAERNRIMATASVPEYPYTDAELDELSERMIAIEKRVRETPARTADGMAAKRPFENGLNRFGSHDSSSGCGPERAVAGWLDLRSELNATRPI